MSVGWATIAGMPTTFAEVAPTSAARREPRVATIEGATAAFLSDIHANTAAFEAVLGDLAVEPVDVVVLNGDITWGTYPSETVDLIRSLRERVPHVVLIRGNGDRAVLELTDGARPAETPRDSWMVARHRPTDLDLLREVVFQVDVAVAGLGTIRCCHGSPRADVECVTPGTPMHRLAEATAGVDADVLLTGHTHIQFRREVEGLPRIRRSVNPGSVGIPYAVDSPGARWLRVDASRAEPFEFRTTTYNIDAYIDGIRATDDPGRERVTDLLRHPPSLAEIVDDTERRVFAD